MLPSLDHSNPASVRANEVLDCPLIPDYGYSSSRHFQIWGQLCLTPRSNLQQIGTPRRPYAIFQLQEISSHCSTATKLQRCSAFTRKLSNEWRATVRFPAFKSVICGDFEHLRSMSGLARSWRRSRQIPQHFFSTPIDGYATLHTAIRAVRTRRNLVQTDTLSAR